MDSSDVRACRRTSKARRRSPVRAAILSERSLSAGAAKRGRVAVVVDGVAEVEEGM